MEKGYKYRIYPTKKQAEHLEIMFSGKRFVWNRFLELNMERFEKKEKILTYNQMSSMLTKLKRANLWLYQCEKSILQNTLKSLSIAYKKFIKGTMKYTKRKIENAARTGKQLGLYDLEKHPKFKSYKNYYQSCKINFTNNNIELKEKSICYTSTGKYKKQNCKVKLPKLKDVKVAYSRQYQGRILSATISKDTDGKYYMSLCCTDIEEQQKYSSGKAVGIDLGIKAFATLSDGKSIENPKYYGQYKDALKKAQKKLSRRKKGGKNRNRQRLVVNKHHKKIHNSRMNFVHQTTTELLNGYDIICIEDLKPKEMLVHKRLAQSISDASFYEFRRTLEYKSEWYRKKVVLVDQYYPSSQLCSKCGYKHEAVRELSVRSWECPSCKKEHNRDLNASINILNEGLRLLREAV